MSNLTCLNPGTNPFTNLPTPCRKCRACRARKKWLKTNLVTMESYAHDRFWLLTLTFRSEKDMVYANFQKFIRALRKRLKGKTPVRYFMVAEHGSKNGRLHYHALVFVNCTKRELLGSEHQTAKWEYGFAHAKLGSPEAIRYVLKYMTKDAILVRASPNLGKATMEAVMEHDMVKTVLASMPGTVVRVGNARPVDGLRAIAARPSDFPHEHFRQYPSENKVPTIPRKARKTSKKGDPRSGESPEGA